ncbi:MAG: argininosuccinate lyase, partial [Phycisphaerales bacterium]
MDMAEKSWEKRLAGGPDKLTVDFVESLSMDRRLYKYDIVGSIAHAQMLAERKLITKDELRKIKSGLIQIGEEIASGQFEFRAEYEDIHMAVEAALVAKIGETGKKLHTGRSRNDQVATDIRLWMRDKIEILQAKITLLQKALVKLAGKYTEDVMPAYTHLQRAQPIVVASYLLSFVEQFQRDFVRLGNCSALLNVSPLGSGAVAGSTLALDRESTAKQLGFSGISYNSIDAVSDRDFCAEFIFACALIATHLSRLAEDWILYSSNEFGFMNIDDAYCTSSSMMPQKRNPDALELIRGKTGRIYGSLMGILTILKGLPSGYNRDMQ